MFVHRCRLEMLLLLTHPFVDQVTRAKSASLNRPLDLQFSCWFKGMKLRYHHIWADIIVDCWWMPTLSTATTERLCHFGIKNPWGNWVLSLFFLLQFVSICCLTLVTGGHYSQVISTALPVTINDCDTACPTTAIAEGFGNAAHMWALITFSAGPCNKVTLVMPLSHPHNQISHKGS